MPAISTVSWLSVVTVPAVCTLCYASNLHILLLVCVTVPAISTLCCLSLWLCQQSLHCADCHNVYIVLVVWLCQQSLHCAGCLWRCQQSLHCADWVTVLAVSTVCCLSVWLCQQSLHCADCASNLYIVLVVWLCHNLYIVLTLPAITPLCCLSVWLCQQSLHCADWVTLLAISTLCCLSGWLISQQFLPRAGCHAGCHVMSTFCWLPVRLSHQYPHLGDYANNVYIVLVVWVICQQYLCCAGSLGDYASSLYVVLVFWNYASNVCISVTVLAMSHVVLVVLVTMPGICLVVWVTMPAISTVCWGSVLGHLASQIIGPPTVSEEKSINRVIIWYHNACIVCFCLKLIITDCDTVWILDCYNYASLSTKVCL